MVDSRKLMAVIKREYLERVRTKWFIITTVFGPVFFLGISVLPGLLTVRNMRQSSGAAIQILDATGSGLGVRVATAMREPAENDPLRKIVASSTPGAAVVDRKSVV